MTSRSDAARSWGLENQLAIFEHARENLTRPAKTWTENAIAQARYAETMLADMLPSVCVEDPEQREALLAAGGSALKAVRGFAEWLRSDLLPRSDRAPTWTPEEIEVYQRVHEGLDEWGVDAMLEPWIDEAAGRARLKAYNPYWTHVVS